MLTKGDIKQIREVVREEVDGRVSPLESTMAQGFGVIAQRFGAVETRLGGVEQGIKSLKKDVREIKSEVHIIREALNGTIDRMDRNQAAYQQAF